MIGAHSDTGRQREQNEDRYVVQERGGTTLMAVADGVGGEAGGEDASAAAVEALARRFFEADTGDLAGALGAAVREANDAVLAATKERGHPNAATTIVAAALRDEQAVIANLGDSRAYLVRGASPRQVTTDHAGDASSSITRFLGDPRGVQPDIFVETLERGDRLVLCSDGLTRHVDDDEIARTAAAGDVSDVARRLVALANERGGEDNITVIVSAASAARRTRATATPAVAALLLIAIAGALAASLFAQPALAPSPSPSPSATAPSAEPSP